MADLPSYPGTPRWVKLAVIIVGVLFILFGIIIVADIGGPHGPGRHLPSDGAGDQTPSEDGS